VRHAEKDTTSPDRDMPLAAAGRRRARELARVLGEAGITTIYATPTRRAMETGAPLAERVGDSLRIVKDTAELVRRLETRHWGSRVLVIGHSDTVPDIVEALCGQRPRALPTSEYDRLYAVTLRRHGPPTVVMLRFGDPSPATPRAAP